MPTNESYVVSVRPGNSTGVGTTVVTADINGVNVASPARVMQDNFIIHDKVMLSVPLVAATVSAFQHVVREGRWRLAGISVYFQTGSTSGTLQVTVDTGTTAPGAGTVQLTSTISLAAASQQLPLNGSRIASPTVAGPGDRFSILIAGTMTSLANGLANISLERVG